METVEFNYHVFVFPYVGLNGVLTPSAEVLRVAAKLADDVRQEHDQEYWRAQSAIDAAKKFGIDIQKEVMREHYRAEKVVLVSPMENDVGGFIRWAVSVKNRNKLLEDRATDARRVYVNFS